MGQGVRDCSPVRFDTWNFLRSNFYQRRRFRVVQGFFAPIDSRSEARDVLEMSVGSPSLVGTIVGNSSDAVINGRPMKKRPLLASVADRSKMFRCDSVINQGADILFRLIVQKRFRFIFLAVCNKRMYRKIYL